MEGEGEEEIIDWSTTCKHHRLKIQCTWCCIPPAGNDTIVISDSDEDEAEKAQAAHGQAFGPEGTHAAESVDAGAQRPGGEEDGDTKSDEDEDDQGKSPGANESSASEGPEKLESGDRQEGLMRAEQAAKDSAKEVAAADASAGSSKYLGAGWTRYTDQRREKSSYGKHYYYNATTGENTWNAPSVQATHGQEALPNAEATTSCTGKNHLNGIKVLLSGSASTCSVAGQVYPCLYVSDSIV